MVAMTDEEIEGHLIAGTKEDELRKFLGDDVYDALRAEAAQVGDTGGIGTEEIFGLGSTAKPFVFILPGIMGSKLSARRNGKNDLVWFDPLDIRKGGVAKLKFGDEPNPIVATGTFWSTYGPLRLRLRARGYKARFMPYDWRRSIPDIGADLAAKVTINGEHGAVLVGHSMGGLVARQIAAMDAEGAIKRVITMGTPNYGSYSPVQVFRLASDMLNKIGWLDRKHSPGQIAKLYLRHFPGLVEMMPDPGLRPDEVYFQPDFWPTGGARPNNGTLADALAAKAGLPLPDGRFHQIIGFGQKTAVAATRTDAELVYKYSRHGDGTVPVDLAQVDGLPQYFVDDTHAGMVQRGDVARAVHELIKSGTTTALSMIEPQVGLATETAADMRGDHDIRQANRSEMAPDDPEAEVILSEFLSAPGALVSLGADTGDASDATSAAPDLSKKIGGYPLSVLLRASRTFRGDEKPKVEAVLRSGRETKERKQKYAARKLQQLRDIVDDAPEQDVLPGLLKEIVVTSRTSPLEAIEALTDERVMGEAEEFLSVLYLKRASIVSKSVGRIIQRSSDRGFGTGFMVAPGVLMTNHHVLGDHEAAGLASVQFDYEINYRHREMQPERFDLRPDLLFYANEPLDFALVGVEPVSRGSQRALSDYAYLPLDGGEGKITIGKPVNIIQHPNAEQKQAVFRDAFLQDLPANDLEPDAQFTGAPSDVAAHYSADTKPGSSGSPVFSDAWEVIALHHSAVAVTKGGEFRMRDHSFMHPNAITDDDQVDWIANEGIRISRITRHLEGVLRDPPLTVRSSDLRHIKSVLDVGIKAHRDGHFDRPLPTPRPPALTAEEIIEGRFDTNHMDALHESAVPELESLISRLRDLVDRIGGIGPSRAARPSRGGALTVDSNGVAHGSGGLRITYRGQADAPYGVSATRDKKPFDSIVLHHNAAHLSTDWLIDYQIDGDAERGGHFGYHFYIDPNGSIHQGAPLVKRTNHVKRPGHTKRKNFGRIASNRNSIGVTCVKAGPNYNPTAAQIASQDALVSALRDAFGIARGNIFGHGEIQSDRSAREGASQAAKHRGGAGNEALVFDDDTDDTMLETFSDPVEPRVGDGIETMPPEPAFDLNLSDLRRPTVGRSGHQDRDRAVSITINIQK